jgi:hypothetical protein
MCRERKYAKFNIKITYLNGDTEDISYNKYDPTNYNDMIQLYKETKEQFKNNCVLIDFNGITSDGEIGILFRKENKTEDLEIKKEANIVEQMSIIEIFNYLENIINILGKKEEKENNNINIYTKKRDILNHKIENIDKINLSNEEKISLMDELHIMSKRRRKSKENVEILNTFTRLQKIQSIRKAINITKQKVQEVRSRNNKSEFLTDDKIKQYRIMEEVKYKNFKERVRLISKLRYKYDKIYYDDSRMIITCYNKAKTS